MGRKNQRTDDPTERIDTKIREVVLELDEAKELVPGLRAIGYLSETKLEASSEAGKGGQPATGRAASSPGPQAAVTSSGGSGLEASSSVTTGARPETAEEWDRRGAELLGAGKQREAVAWYREAVMVHPDLRTRIRDLAGQYRDANLELAYCLDPSDKGLAAAWAKAGGQRRSLCAESM
jgi:hypothetical protein